jgi:uncharacterized iron-regulated membrane protein
MLPSNVPEFERSEAPGPGRGRRGGEGRLVLSVIGVLVVLALLVAGGLYVLFSTQQQQQPSQTSAARPTSASAPAPTSAAAAPTSAAGAAPAAVAGPTADPATADAIKQVIQKGNQAQVQAIAAGDPSPMRDTSTPDYYQELVQTNTELLSAGVTAIRLVQVEWGAITVNGSTATVECWETWNTTLANSTTEQSRDRNIYTLVQQNGAWVIQADDHPDQPAPSGPPTPAARPAQPTR